MTNSNGTVPFLSQMALRVSSRPRGQRGGSQRHGDTKAVSREVRTSVDARAQQAQYGDMQAAHRERVEARAQQAQYDDEWEDEEMEEVLQAVAQPSASLGAAPPVRTQHKHKEEEEEEEEEDWSDDDDFPMIQEAPGVASLGAARPAEPALDPFETELQARLVKEKTVKEIIQVLVERCNGLKDLETMSVSDPYVKILLKDPDGAQQEFKTAYKDGNLNPEYGETFELSVTKAMWGGYKEYTTELVFEVVGRRLTRGEPMECGAGVGLE